MDWIEIKSEEAEKVYDEYCIGRLPECDESYHQLKSELCSIYQEIKQKLESQKTDANRRAYLTDLEFGIRMYSLLTEKYGMNIRSASTEGIWRYLCSVVVPELIDDRYGKDHPDRFWKKPKRLWLRVLWWYIYLSWQGNAKLTYQVLKDNSTDEILQLVDRCGRGGYRVTLYREIMKKYSELDTTERRQSEIFRKMMVLNTARVQVIEPELVSGGVKEYVNLLYEYFQ